ncbi:hypothetical protein ACLK1S_19330 [Escherichia coli]
MSIALWHAASGLSWRWSPRLADQYARAKPIRDENGLAVDFKSTADISIGNNDQRVDSIACYLA